MDDRRMLRLLLALTALGVVSAGCGVSKAKYLTATQSVESLTTQNQKLQSDLQGEKAKAAGLEQKTASMQSSVDQLNADLERQKHATSEVQSTYEGMVTQLRDEVSSGNVQVQRMRDGIRVNLAQDILFKSGSAALDKSGKDVLGKVAEELKNSAYEVVVIGHTDNQKIGANLAQRFPSNWSLGSARAGSIVGLFEGAGIAPGRLLTVSAGENRPRADNATAEGRGLNRRIEIRLRPIEIEERAAQE